MGTGSGAWGEPAAAPDTAGEGARGVQYCQNITHALLGAGDEQGVTRTRLVADLRSF